MWSVEYVSFDCPGCGAEIRRRPECMASGDAMYCLLCGFNITVIPRVKVHWVSGPGRQPRKSNTFSRRLIS